MAIEPRPQLMATRPAVHGSPDHAELAALGLHPEAVLDFSVNANAYGHSPRVARALADALARGAAARYPDDSSLSLRQALASMHGLEADQVIVGNGSAELIHLLAFAYLRRSDAAFVLGPTFAEYARASCLMGAHLHSWVARAENGFQVHSDEVLAELQRLSPRLTFVCNPNNPTGLLLPPTTIAAWADACPATLFVVDEAYVNFVAEPASASCLGLARPNLLVLRSLTKDYGLAGLRLGYAVGPAATLLAVERARPPWNINALAQAAGLAAISDQEYLHHSLRALRAAKEHLVCALAGLGLAVVPSSTHYFLVEVGDAAGLRRRLLRRGILVRDCASFGLPAYVRIAARRPEENGRLLAAMEDEPWV